MLRYQNNAEQLLNQTVNHGQVQEAGNALRSTMPPVFGRHVSETRCADFPGTPVGGECADPGGHCDTLHSESQRPANELSASTVKRSMVNPPAAVWASLVIKRALSS